MLERNKNPLTQKKSSCHAHYTFCSNTLVLSAVCSCSFFYFFKLLIMIIICSLHWQLQVVEVEYLESLIFSVYFFFLCFYDLKAFAVIFNILRFPFAGFVFVPHLFRVFVLFMVSSVGFRCIFARFYKTEICHCHTISILSKAVFVKTSEHHLPPPPCKCTHAHLLLVINAKSRKRLGLSKLLLLSTDLS